VNTQTIRDFLSTRAEYTPKTRRKELEHVRFLLWFCVSQGWIENNPASGHGEGKSKAIRIKVPKGGSYQPFTEEEVERLLQAAETINNNNKRWINRARLRARAMILVMCYSGLRISDVATLRRDEVQPTGLMKDHMLVKTKVLHWTRFGEDTLRALLALPVESEYFFWSGPKESKMTTCCGTMRRTLSSIGKRTSIAVHPHRFRNTFSLRVMDETNDIRTLQQLLGHQNLSSTQAYLHNSTKQDQHLHDTLAKIQPGGKVIQMPSKSKSA
jgi:site-specific recombinase XerD